MPKQQTDYDFVRRYQADPMLFFTEVLDVKPEYVWSKMEEVAYSVRDNNKTVVKAGHSVSKSYTAARLAIWFLACHYPSTVVTTAPTDRHIRQVLWREIHAALANARRALGGHLTTLEYLLGEKWFATGFSTRPDSVTENATAFQGYHNEHVLIIFDEAVGVMRQIWEAAHGLFVGPHWRFLAIGNPTSEKCEFRECFDDPTYNHIQISVMDTPNFKQGADIIPGLAGVDYEKEIRDKYGIDSNVYKYRILGEFPAYSEGTYYGHQVQECERSGRIGNVPHDPATPVYVAMDMGMDCTPIIFFQLVGQEIHLVDYYENTGMPISHYTDVMQSRRFGNRYAYSKVFVPQDANKKEMVSGSSMATTLQSLGYEVVLLDKEKNVDAGINQVMDAFPRFWVDRIKCNRLIEALRHYRREFSYEHDTYLQKPVHDWSSHPCDALRYLVKGLSRIGGVMTLERWRELKKKYA